MVCNDFVISDRLYELDLTLVRYECHQVRDKLRLVPTRKYKATNNQLSVSYACLLSSIPIDSLFDVQLIA